MLSLIVAIASDGAIGRKGTLPWHISDDLKHFKKITRGHTMLMGMNTFISLIQRILKILRMYPS